MRGTESPLADAKLFGGQVWEIGITGVVVCARGNGAAPGERLLRALDARRILVQVGPTKNVPGPVGGPAEAAIAGGRAPTSMQTGGTSLARHCVAPSYKCKPRSTCVRSEFAPRGRYFSGKFDKRSSNLAAGRNFEIYILPSSKWAGAGGVDGRMRARGEHMRVGAISVVGRPVQLLVTCRGKVGIVSGMSSD